FCIGNAKSIVAKATEAAWYARGSTDGEAAPWGGLLDWEHGMHTNRQPHPVPEILVVDHDAATHAALSLQFSQDAVEVTLVRDRAACLDRVAGRTPALIVVDLCVSHDTGLDLLRDLKARH